jgi:hypothetical protein
MDAGHVRLRSSAIENGPSAFTANSGHSTVRCPASEKGRKQSLRIAWRSMPADTTPFKPHKWRLPPIEADRSVGV